MMRPMRSRASTSVSMSPRHGQRLCHGPSGGSSRPVRLPDSLRHAVITGGVAGIHVPCGEYRIQILWEKNHTSMAGADMKNHYYLFLKILMVIGVLLPLSCNL